MLKFLTTLGLKLFGKRIKKEIQKYHEVGVNLKKAMIPIPLELYIATAKISAVLVGIIGLITGIIVSRFIYVPPFPFYIPEPIYSFWMNYRSTVFSVLMALALSFAAYELTFSAFKIYPSIVVGDRKSKIDRMLHHAVAFMHALSIGGTDIYRLFKTLAEHRDVYGEVSREVSRIVKDVEYGGMDLRSALTNAVELSPSENYKEFLHGLITVIDSGGDIRSYLEERVEYFFEKARQSQKAFLELLGMMAESYVTALVAAPLFLIIIEIVMLLMGEGNEYVLYAVIYLFIPIGSALFAGVVKMISPTDDMEAPEIKEGDKEFKILKKNIKLYKIKKALRNPIQILKRKPYYVFVFSIPLGLSFALYGLSVVGFYPSMDWFFSFDDYLLVSIILTLLPFVILHEIRVRSIRRYLRYIPIFLNRLASINESGVPIYRAISILAKTDTSPLRNEIRKIKTDIDWGLDLSRAFVRFANRIRVFDVTRVVTMLNEAMKTTGNLTDVLVISAKEASRSELIKRERYYSMVMYTIIIYVAFFVFIGITYIISSMFLTAFTVSPTTPSTTTPVVQLNLNVDFYKNLLMHGAIFQGLFGGLVAGIMGEGSVSSGLKHSIVMLVIAYMVFTTQF